MLHNLIHLKTALDECTKEIKNHHQHIAENERTGKKSPCLLHTIFLLQKLLMLAGVDVILAGDSASNVMAGHETTLPINTLDQMTVSCAVGDTGASRSLVVVDLPFGSYQSNSEIALASVRIMKETGAHAVKLEGGEEVLESIRRIISAGVPVMGHLGLAPQSIYKFGTYSVRAKEEEEAEKLKADAKVLEDAGCFAIVLEKIPALLAKEVSESVIIPTIGIGAGNTCIGRCCNA